jgi:hypothetical protein
MRKIVAIAAIAAAMLVLGSCSGAGGGAVGGDGGILGNSFTLSGQIYRNEKGYFGDPWTYDGDLCFAMAGPSEELFLGTAAGGAFSITIGALADPTDKHPWVDILPTAGTVSISDPTATGCVINEVVWDVADPKITIHIVRGNAALTTIVYWAYTDKDVHISYTGVYDGTNSMDIDANLKAGWSRLISTRTGAGPYLDTIRIGEEPAGVCWGDDPRSS